MTPDNHTEQVPRTDCDACPMGHGQGRTTAREAKLKSNLSARLNRVEGQIRGIGNMVDKDVYCDDILNQIAAVQSAINAISKLVLEQHIRGCLVDRLQKGDDTIIDELLTTFGKLL